jgi:hypothetical protein
MVEEAITTTEFLAQKVYLPGYMGITSEDYNKDGATFDFRVKEPLVTRGNIVEYLTPRGLHICISQGSYALVENLIREDEFGEWNIETLRESALEGRVKITELNQKFKREIQIAHLREILLEGRVKITELYQKFGKEVGLGKPVQGRFNIERFRPGKMPILKLGFSFGNGAIIGKLTSVIAQKPTPQTNADIMRN